MSERLGCAALTLAHGEPLIGSAPNAPRFLAIEVPLPWKENPWKSPHAPAGVHEALKRAQERKVKVKPLALEPDPAYSEGGLTRVMLFTKPKAPFPLYGRAEFLVPHGRVTSLVEALLGEPGRDLSEFDEARLGNSPVRDLMVCTHGADDPCCGTLGYPVFQAMRGSRRSEVPQLLRVWRVSHIGGHRFAPTVLDFPEGRCWGHLNAETARRVALKEGPVERLNGQYRGWGPLGFFEQLAERELFLREGWAWTAYPKASRVTAVASADWSEPGSEKNPALAKDPPLWAGALGQKRTGDVMVSLGEGIDQLQSYFGEYLPQLIVSLLTPVGLFIFMSFLDVPTALIYLVSAIVTVVAPAMFHRRNVASSARRRVAYGDLAAEYLDSIQGLSTLKAFGQSKARGNVIAEKARFVYRSTMKVLAANMASTGITWLGITIGAGLALGSGALRVADGSLELATLLVMVMLGVEVFRPLREMVRLYHQGMLGMASAKAVFDLMESKPVTEDTAKAPANSDLEPSIEFRSVTFAYPTRPKPALTGVSFKVEPGKTVAVVGPSGVGKSTLVWLALRFMDPAEGSVLIGGKDVKELPLELLRKQIAVVTQDNYLFHGTVAENLRFGKPGATYEELERAAKIANAHEFISALPQGYDTLIGERGVKLSGGQRQRIAIARAVLKDAPILVLDEALSSVDAENEAIIQEALERLMKGRTTLVIAHRLSSVIHAHRIYVLEDGRLMQEGTHASLLAQDGVYARLMAGQVQQAGARRASAEANGTSAPSEKEKAAPSRTQDAAVLDNAAKRESSIMGSDGTPLSIARVFLRLLALVRDSRYQLTVTFFLGVIRVLILMSIGVISGLIVRQVTVGGDLTGLLIALAAAAAFTPFVQWGETWLAHDTAFRLLAEMRIDMYKKLDPLSPAYLVRRRSGDVVSTATTDVETVELFFAHTIAPAFVAVAVPGGILIAIALVQWQLALALLPFILFVAWSPLQSQKSLDKLGLQACQALGEVMAHLVDSVQGMREIAAFGYEKHRLEEVVQNQLALRRVRLRFFQAIVTQRILIEMCIGLGGLTVLGLGAYLVSQGSMPANNLPLVSLLALSSFIPVAEIAQTARQLADTVGSARRVFSVHDEPVPVRDGSGLPKEAQRRGAVEFQGVKFAYGPALPQPSRMSPSPWSLARPSPSSAPAAPARPPQPICSCASGTRWTARL